MAVKVKTYQMTVNHTGDREAVTCTNKCETVEVQELPSVENPQLYYVSDVPSGGVAAERNAGTPFFFNAGKRGIFEAGETVGYIATETGPTTFQRIEHLVEP